jgi:hypothetical protein
VRLLVRQGRDTVSRWPDPAERAELWRDDPDMRRLAEVGRDLGVLRVSYEQTVAPLLAERDELVLKLIARGALVAEIAVRAGVSDSLMSRRVKRLRGRASPRP